MNPLGREILCPPGKKKPACSQPRHPPGRRHTVVRATVPAALRARRPLSLAVRRCRVGPNVNGGAVQARALQGGRRRSPSSPNRSAGSAGDTESGGGVSPRRGAATVPEPRRGGTPPCGTPAIVSPLRGSGSRRAPERGLAPPPVCVWPLTGLDDRRRNVNGGAVQARALQNGGAGAVSRHEPRATAVPAGSAHHRSESVARRRARTDPQDRRATHNQAGA